MAQEIEIKLALADPEALRAKLKKRGGQLVSPNTNEENLLLDNRNGGLKKSSSALRVRVYGKSATMTWKGPKIVRQGIRTREEIEIEISSAKEGLAMLRALGYTPVLRYLKQREVWRLTDALVMIDTTNAGCFVEIEADEQVVKDTTKELGFDITKAINSSYATLIGEPLTDSSNREFS
jgi:adenylate cyclase class 2